MSGKPPSARRRRTRAALGALAIAWLAAACGWTTSPAPAGLAYAVNPAVYAVGVAITPNTPATSGGPVRSYDVEPPLPSGLALDPRTGVISGTPSAVAAEATYTVRASNDGGSATAGLVLSVNASVTPPTGLTYAVNPADYTVGSAIPPNAPTSGGGAVSSYSVSPALPTGLSLDPVTGVISGTPAAVSAAATYTVTASNSAGSTTAGVTISVTAALLPPSGLTYAVNPALYTTGTPIAANTPRSSGGAVSSYSVSPALPAGLSLNATTGIISGTPSAVTATRVYTVTAGNAAGSTTAGLTLTVDAALQPPSGLTYAVNPATYTVGTPIAANTPTSSGGAVTSYSVSPTLPKGLSLNPTSGILSGTPTAVDATRVYTVTASNAAGSTTVGLSITVNAALQPPSGLTYAVNSATYTVGTAIAANTPTSSGGAVASYAVAPALPAGLSLNTATGAISGTPTAVTPTAVYTVTATNAAGSTTADVSITVDAALQPPSGLAYAANPATYTVGTAITGNTPSSSGGAVASYAVAPALPAGLSLNTATGAISGTPTAVTPTAVYTVTAKNAAGSTTADVSITVGPVPPGGLTYPENPANYTVGTAIAANTPTLAPDTQPLTFTVNPALPAGLSLDTATGVISGTPTAVAAATVYTVTATNAAGSTTADVTITVLP